MDEGTAQIRERPKAKLLPRGTTGGLRGPGVGGESGESDTLSRVREEGGGQDRQQARPSPSKTSVSGATSAAAGAPPPHNHKVPVLISPTLKHGTADVHLVGVDSQGNRFKLLTDHQGERDRPRLVKPKCAPPPPPTLRGVSHSYSGDGEEQIAGAPAAAEVNGDTLKGPHRPGRTSSGGTGAGRPSVPPPQVPPASAPSLSPSPSAAAPTNNNTPPAKLANGSAPSALPSTGSKAALRRTRQQAERPPQERASRKALLECAECLSHALHGGPESPSSSQVLDSGHQLLGYCSGYVDRIPQMRNKFAFREAVGKLELSLQEVRASSAGGAGLSSLGCDPALDNLHSCVKEISDLVQR